MQTTRTDENTKLCPFCAEIIQQQAIRCKHCHADLTARNRTWNPGIAAALSVVAPGLGHVYKGRILLGLSTLALSAGTVWLFLSGANNSEWEIQTAVPFLVALLPGFVAYVGCILDAYRDNQNPKRAFPAMVRVAFFSWIAVACYGLFYSNLPKNDDWDGSDSVYATPAVSTGTQPTTFDEADYEAIYGLNAHSSNTPSSPAIDPVAMQSTKPKSSKISVDQPKFKYANGKYSDENVEITFAFVEGGPADQENAESMSQSSGEAQDPVSAPKLRGMGSLGMSQDDAVHQILVTVKNISPTKIVYAGPPCFPSIMDNFGNRFSVSGKQLTDGKRELYPGEESRWQLSYGDKLIPSASSFKMDLFKDDFGASHSFTATIPRAK